MSVRHPRLRQTLDGRYGGPLTHSFYTTCWDTTVVGMGNHAFGFRFWHVFASLADFADAEDRGFIQMPLSKPPK